jgi:hypothetical protein
VIELGNNATFALIVLAVAACLITRWILDAKAEQADKRNLAARALRRTIAETDTEGKRLLADVRQLNGEVRDILKDAKERV